MLWEEWNIFDEYSLMRFTREGSNEGFLEFNNQMLALKDRAAKNLADIQSISPPVCLNEFWVGIGGAIDTTGLNATGAIDTFYLATRTYFGGGSGPFVNWMFERAMARNAQAWLALNNTCRQYNIKMEWPLPRSP